MKKLEAQFRTEVERFNKATQDMREEIGPFLAAVKTNLEAVVSVSEKYGIPFFPRISGIRKSYIPKSRLKLSELADRCDHESHFEFEKEEQDLLDELGGNLDELPYGNHAGWNTSALC